MDGSGSTPISLTPSSHTRSEGVPMELTALLCTDGSESALGALAAGLAVLGPARRVVIATVVEPGDPTLVTGTGMAAGVMSADDFDQMEHDRHAAASAVLDQARTALDLADAEALI